MRAQLSTYIMLVAHKCMQYMHLCSPVAKGMMICIPWAPEPFLEDPLKLQWVHRPIKKLLWAVFWIDYDWCTHYASAAVKCSLNELSESVIVLLEGSKMTKWRCFCIFWIFATRVHMKQKLFIPIDCWVQGLSAGSSTFGVNMDKISLKIEEKSTFSTKSRKGVQFKHQCK